MLKNIALKAYVSMACRNVKNAEQNERGITAIEYAIIGVAMASALFFIFDKGGFIESLSAAWNTMATKITASGNILK
ncbi:Flp family type IVb pilin [Serratia bockelmannii]|uniref:Flp family type IVb pilin n=1 Tax=Serratia bockelmannii TaxID=2703793 RepID=UPI003FA7ABA1